MNTNDLRNIREFPDLVKYLRDELNWPIDLYDFDQLTYEYDPAELGIDSNAAVNIEEIKQLRPMVDDQPWGIFFVRFAPKRLPVVALRRILSSLAIKKRASARVSERATWKINDLLFISSFGEVVQRQITFAHFSHDGHSVELPTLRVLGWDEADTFLHIDHVQNELHHKLTWPKNEKDVDSWRSNWSSAFTLSHREVITTSKELAVRLAALARQIRKRANSILSIETENGPIRKLHHAFRDSLIHDLSEDDFADMYAQTITYGLLSARLANPKGRTADELAVQIPVTNPFLKELMETFLNVGGRKARAGGGGIDFDELGISEVVGLLNNSNMEAVIRDFGDKNPQEDPVIHFYELFLKEYDPKKRMQRGVFYTPRPVVSYIVRSVDELLRNEFGLEDGLADITTWGEMAKRHKDLKIPEGVSPDQDFVQILDPATGTGTFLVEAIDFIHKTLVAKWKSHGHSNEHINALWNEYIPKHLLTRLHGYELLMAPYTIAHLKVGIKLYETGYQFESDERAHVYLTNALEPAQDFSARFDFAIPALAHEAQSVNTIKKRTHFTVVIGNPPYSGESSNTGGWISALIKEYRYVEGKPLGEANPRWLQDDYVKFIRLAQHLVATTKVGIVGLITNHAFLDNATFRGARQNLLDSFSRAWFLDLHGNTKKMEKHPNGSIDVNVFEIQQGVAISLWLKSPKSNFTQLKHADVFGTRKYKSEVLSNSSLSEISWQSIHSKSPFYLFMPQDQTLFSEYQEFIKITEAMPLYSNGIVTARDHMCIRWSAEEVWAIVKEFANLTPEEARRHFQLGVDSRDWQVKLAQADLNRDGPSLKRVVPIYYRPFDTRWTYFTGRSRGYLCMPRGETMSHMLGEKNIALITSRMTKGEVFQHAQSTRNISEAIVMSPKTSNNGFIFPLYIIPDSFHKGTLTLNSEVFLNFGPAFLRQLATNFNLSQTASYGLPSSLEPEDIFYYIYAILNCPSYRSRYAEFLKIDFPRLPLPRSLEFFRALVPLGGELVSLHLLESPELDCLITESIGDGSKEVEKVSWSNDTVWIDKAQTTGFKGVLEDVWNFHIGGYQVCEKWLKDRKGRTLSEDDINHYQKIVVALTETIRLMKEIDQVIEEHGGWPGAFLKKTR